MAADFQLCGIHSQLSAVRWKTSLFSSILFTECNIHDTDTDTDSIQ